MARMFSPASRRTPRRRSLPAISLLAGAIVLALPGIALAQEEEGPAADGAQSDATTLDTVHVTAEAIARQALGTSVITAEDIERRPPANDLSELIRTMPGVNLTGNSSSGQYGNNRQIDLRGMGPENTLILVDGKPIGSRDSIRMGRSGERNTRDVLVAEIPAVLHRELYAIAALLGAAMVAAGSALGFPVAPAAIAGACACFLLRFMAIRRGWNLPIARLRDVDD